jgi:F-type H+-transporting ATPase subunit b
MLIDWFTVGAQIVNFLVLVALMKHLLYGPLIRAIDAREARIAAQLTEAEQKNQQAKSATEQLKKEIAELENNRAQTIADARSEAASQKNELIQTARESVRALDTKWREDLRLEKAAFFNEVRHAASAEVFSIARRVLADLANADIERCAVQVFLQKLRSSDPCELKKLAGGGMTAVSATPLSAELRRQVQETIETRIGSPVPLVFEIAPEMTWGIDLRGAGQRIGWTPDGYMDSLEEKLKIALEERAELGAPVTAQ